LLVTELLNLFRQLPVHELDFALCLLNFCVVNVTKILVLVGPSGGNISLTARAAESTAPAAIAR
jgi:hypothetical protein